MRHERQAAGVQGERREGGFPDYFLACPVYCLLTLCHVAAQLAIDYGIKFLETSAKSSINVEEVSHGH